MTIKEFINTINEISVKHNVIASLDFGTGAGVYLRVEKPVGHSEELQKAKDELDNFIKLHIGENGIPR